MYNFDVFQYFYRTKPPLTIYSLDHGRHFVSIHQFFFCKHFHTLITLLNIVSFFFYSFLKTHHLANQQIHQYQKRSMDF